MSSIFQSFATGYQAGEALSQRRQETAAMRKAAAAFQAGDSQGASAALLSEGLINEANAYDDMGERARARSIRDKAMAAMQGGGDRTQRLAAGRDAALEGGDLDLYAQLDDAWGRADEGQRKSMIEASDWMAQSLETLRGTPQAERAAKAQAMVQQGPYATQLAGKLSGLDLSDDGIERAQTAVLSVGDQINMRWQKSRAAVDDARNARDYDLRVRELNSRALERQRVKLSDLRQLRSDYGRAQQDLMELREQVGITREYAAQVNRQSGKTQGVDKDTVRVNDGAMLMIAARMIQGPGILTDQDVDLIRGHGLDGAINNLSGFITGNQQLSTRQRHALADIITRRSSQIDKRLKEVYEDHAAFAEGQGISPNEAGIVLPSHLREGAAEPAAPAQESSVPPPPKGSVHVRDGVRWIYKGGPDSNRQDPNNWQRASNPPAFPRAPRDIYGEM